MPDNEFIDYLLTNIPTLTHDKVKTAAKDRRISMKQWIMEAIKEKLKKGES